jgi:hypothetical protein
MDDEKFTECWKIIGDQNVVETSSNEYFYLTIGQIMLRQELLRLPVNNLHVRLDEDCTGNEDY